MKSLRLLLIEDQEDDALLIGRALEQGGFALDTHRVASEAALRAAIAQGGWDLVLSDYRVPPLNGLAIIRIVKELAPQLSVIIISGTVGEDTAVAAMHAGAQDFLVKGNLARLVPAVERELRESQERVARSRADAALRSSERRFRSLVSSIDGLVITLDPVGLCTGVFGRWLERPDFGEERFLGKTIAAALGDGDPRNAAMIVRCLAGEPGTLEWPMDDGSGVPRQLEMSLSPLRDDAGEACGLVALIHDKTEQKQAFAQLLVADRMASVGTLAAGVAHEINNPLAAVIANLDYVTTILGGEGGQPAGATEEMHEAITEAHDAAGQVRQIVRDLKLFSGSGDEERRGPVDLNRVLDSASRMAWNEIRHRARLVKHYADVPAVDGNEPRLGQVFLNLIMNAVQAIPEGHATEHEITLTTRVDAAGQIVAEVRDSGAGIPPEVLVRLFTPFFTTKPVGIGTGLGLPICHRIVTGLGGTINVASQVGHGTTSTVVLHPAFKAVPSAVRPAAAAGGVRARVLIVDDEPAVRTSLRRTLGRDHDVTDVATGKLALERLRNGELFDVIICDLMMPEMTGMELFALLEEEHPEHARKVVFLTGGAFTPSARDFLASTPNTWMEKPYDSAALKRLVADRVARAAPATTPPTR